MLLLLFLAPDRVYCLIWGLYPADKRAGWGAALQPKQTGGLCALKHKHHPYWLKYPCPNEGTVNYDPQHVPIVATRLVDVGASPHIYLIRPLGDLEVTPLLFKPPCRGQLIALRNVRRYLYANFLDAHREPDVGDRAAVLAIPSPQATPTPREDTTPSHKLPHLQPFAQEVVNPLTPPLNLIAPSKAKHGG